MNRTIWILVALVVIIGAGYFWSNQTPTLHAPQILKTLSCSPTLYWNIEQRDVLFTSRDDLGSHTSVVQNLNFMLYSNSSLIYGTNATAGWSLPKQLTFAENSAYHIAVAELSGHHAASFTAPTGSTTIQDPSIVKAALACLYSNFPGDTVGTLGNFPATIPLKTTPGFITLLPGQSASGVIDGKKIVLNVDGNSPYRFHMFVDGTETNRNEVLTVGDISFDPNTQYADGSEPWQVTTNAQ